VGLLLINRDGVVTVASRKPSNTATVTTYRDTRSDTEPLSRLSSLDRLPGSGRSLPSLFPFLHQTTVEATQGKGRREG
jgi:hypothetical protein